MLELVPSLVLWTVGSYLYGGISGWPRWLLMVWGVGLVLKPIAGFISRAKAGLPWWRFTIRPGG